MPRLALLAGLAAATLGAATATDLVSLRELAHAVDVPLLSAGVIALRNGMPNSFAHALEPALGVSGALMLAMPMPARLRPTLVARPRLAEAPARA